jgi:biotin operon repressor
MSNQIKFKAHFDFVLKALVLLQNPVSMKELKKGLSLTDRSVYRWIQHLEELGFEVEKTIS